jgi:hypothetical protein
MRWSRYPQLESSNKVTRAPLTNAGATSNRGYSAGSRERRNPKDSWIYDNLVSCCEVTPMNKSERLKRAAECTRLAGLQAIRKCGNLGLSWMQVAAEPD